MKHDEIDAMHRTDIFPWNRTLAARSKDLSVLVLLFTEDDGDTKYKMKSNKQHQKTRK